MKTPSLNNLDNLSPVARPVLPRTPIKRPSHRLEHVVKYHIHLWVKDERGRVIALRRLRGRSWTYNLYYFIRMFLQGKKLPNVYGTQYYVDLLDLLIDDTGTARGIRVCVPQGDTGYIGVNAPAGNDAYGIVVGISNAAFDPSQTDLISKISHGSETGQLLYGETTIEVPTSTTLRIIRTFSNASGAAIDIYELGLKARLFHRAGTVYYALFARDVLSSPISVPDGSTLTVRYIVSM